MNICHKGTKPPKLTSHRKIATINLVLESISSLKPHALRLCAFVAMLMMFCSPEQKNTTTAHQQPQEIADQEGWNSTIKITDKGNLRANIEYGHMERYSAKKMIFFDQDVHIDFYNEKGEIGSVLTAEEGKLDENTNNMRAAGNVMVDSDSGMTLYTEELYYLDARDEIVSEVEIKITTEKGDTLYGVGFQADPQMTYYQIGKPHGISSTSLDLSIERLKKEEADSSPDSSAIDSLQADSASAISDSVNADTHE